MRIVRTDPTEGSIFHMADGRWRAQLQIGFVNGKRRRISKTAATKREVTAWLTAAKRAQAKGVDVSAERVTLAQFVERWLENPPAKLRPNTLRAYGYCWRRIEPDLGKLRVARLSLEDVRGFLAKRTAAGAAANTMALDRAFLRRILEDAERDSIVDRNVVRWADVPTAKRTEREPWTPDEARTFLEATREHRLFALFNVALALGLRSGEVRGLRWEDVDLKGGKLQVRVQMLRVKAPPEQVSNLRPAAYKAAALPVELSGSAPQSGYDFAPPKSARSTRELGIPAELVAILTGHEQRQRRERMRAGAAWEGVRWGLVFPARHGQPMAETSLRKTFHTAVTNAGLRDIHFHDLRHIAASFHLATGATMQEVQYMLGHHSIAMTMDIYAHLLPDKQREATARAGALLWGAG